VLLVLLALPVLVLLVLVLQPRWLSHRAARCGVAQELKQIVAAGRAKEVVDLNLTGNSLK
jgi:hypothetical protein